MDTVTLQVPISKTVRDNATIVAKDQGFSSLQEIIRVLVTKFSKKELSLSVTEDEFVKLSPRAAKRYAKMEEDFRLGRNVKTANSVEELMRDLRS